jgi:hypothetical protein
MKESVIERGEIKRKTKNNSKKIQLRAKVKVKRGEKWETAGDQLV